GGGARQGGGALGRQPAGGSLPGLVLLRPQRLQGVRGARLEGQGAGAQGADAARVPGPRGEGGAHQVRRPVVAPLLMAAVLAACSVPARPARSPPPPNRAFGQMMADTTGDTQVLGDASATANEVVRNAPDCEVAKPLVAEARAKLDAAEPRLRTGT